MRDTLLARIISSIRTTIEGSKIGLAFSGGVDSSLLARLCDNLGYDVTLLTVGFRDSHDLSFAGLISESLEIPHRTLEIDPATFGETAEEIVELVRSENLSWQENSVAFHYVAELARTIGIDTVVTANGIDELFCGYDAYRRAMLYGEEHVLEMIDSKVSNELKMIEAINLVTARSGVKMVQPLLRHEFITYAMTLPLLSKIRGPCDLLRKHAIRELAADVGVPKISAYKKKKAIQYGSRIHKEMIRYKKSLQRPSL